MAAFIAVLIAFSPGDGPQLDRPSSKAWSMRVFPWRIGSKHTELPQPASNPLVIYPAKSVLDENRLLAIVFDRK
ncbi:hypothetical protein IE4872_CH00946 [Rhizobium gallicum]|uniref:Uncharacterized protein n=1 Tax=Rhizobium gallicum TaxID=56730 RepID=A0A1L5NFH5_9HYPH|nr:hypothetical protein IE4872_CH00946 [Rhizobium gallicum]